jgi:hypothetical protein
VKTSVLDRLYEDLPVLIVEEWSDVTKELLVNTIKEFKEKHQANEFNYDKLSLKYWVDQIDSYKVPPLRKVESNEESNEELNNELNNESNEELEQELNNE